MEETGKNELDKYKVPTLKREKKITWKKKKNKTSRTYETKQKSNSHLLGVEERDEKESEVEN
jgi:hypothetical protein